MDWVIAISIVGYIYFYEAMYFGQETLKNTM